MKCWKSFCLLAFFICWAGTPLPSDAAGSKGGFYLGAFGGLGALSSTSLRQIGTVRLPEPLPDLSIDAKGDTSSPHVKTAGLQFGYEWASWPLGTSGWSLRPAAELEGLYLGKHSPKGEMPIDPGFLGTQYVRLPMRGHALLANAVFTLETPVSQRFFPYLGVGAGVARISISGADSANPSEPGINHFNSDPDAADTALAAQIRLGLKGRLTEQLFLFTEYRYLTIGATRYSFGRTDYAGQHPPTDMWAVRMGRLEYNLFLLGLQYRF